MAVMPLKRKVALGTENPRDCLAVRPPLCQVQGDFQSARLARVLPVWKGVGVAKW